MVLVAILNRVVRVDFIEKVTLEQRLERNEAMCQGWSGYRLLEAEAPAEMTVLKQDMPGAF